MYNHYKGWDAANKSLQDINTISKALSKILPDLPIAPMHQLVIQGFLLQIAQRINDYTEEVKPLMEAENV